MEEVRREEVGKLTREVIVCKKWDGRRADANFASPRASTQHDGKELPIFTPGIFCNVSGCNCHECRVHFKY